MTPEMWPHCDGPNDLAAIEAVPVEARELPLSTYDALRRTTFADPDRIAIVALPNGQQWQAPIQLTYGDLLAKVTSYANVLWATGVRRRDGIGILSPNVAELIPALLAAETAGIAVPINPGLDRDIVAALLRRAGVSALIAAGPDVDARVWELAQEVSRELGLEAVFALRPTGAEHPAESDHSYLDELAGSAVTDRLLGAEPGADDIAAFFHTGGTTGTPKLAAHTHRMQVVDAWSIATISTLSQDSTVFAALPLFHVNALIVTTLVPILRGMGSVWAGPLGYRDPELLANFWKIVERYRITSMSGVPSVYDVLSRMPVDADTSSLRLPIVGAAPLPPAVRTTWASHTGVPLCEGYGLTEATCATARSFPNVQRIGSAGQRLPYQRVAAVDIDRRSGEWTFLSPGQRGTLVISGPTVFPGYVVGRDANGPVLDASEKVRDGWLDTGDLGCVSDDGFVTLTGRAKDVIIRGGHNIDPAEIEEVLREHPDVIDAAVVGRPDQHAGEVPVGFVVVGNSAVDADELQRWAATRVPERAAAPKVITILPALPHTAVGKPYKLGLRILATKQELAAQLRGIGLDVPPDDSWCDQQDGQIVVTLPRPSDKERHAAASNLLGRYALDWRFA
jgi:fatty-acyl-CoA synthase